MLEREIEAILYKNSFVALKRSEKNNILLKWKKEIIVQATIDILGFPVLFLLLFHMLKMTSQDIIDKVVKCIGIGVLVYVLVWGIWMLIYEFCGYLKYRNVEWFKSLVYIEGCKRGRAEGRYVVNGEEIRGILVPQYRRFRTACFVHTFSVLVHFQSAERYIILEPGNYFELNDI